jgi:hypothetical protein
MLPPLRYASDADAAERHPMLILIDAASFSFTASMPPPADAAMLFRFSRWLLSPLPPMPILRLRHYYLRYA